MTHNSGEKQMIVAQTSAKQPPKPGPTQKKPVNALEVHGDDFLSEVPVVDSGSRDRHSGAVRAVLQSQRDTCPGIRTTRACVGHERVRCFVFLTKPRRSQGLNGQVVDLDRSHEYLLKKNIRDKLTTGDSVLPCCTNLRSWEQKN